MLYSLSVLPCLQKFLTNGLPATTVPLTREKERDFVSVDIETVNVSAAHPPVYMAKPQNPTPMTTMGKR